METRDHENGFTSFWGSKLKKNVASKFEGFPFFMVHCLGGWHSFEEIFKTNTKKRQDS